MLVVNMGMVSREEVGVGYIYNYDAFLQKGVCFCGEMAADYIMGFPIRLIEVYGVNWWSGSLRALGPVSGSEFDAFFETCSDAVVVD
jgi:hypothetical protein